MQSCRRLLSTFTVRQAPFGCRCSSGTVPFLYLIIFFICSVSPVGPFLPLLFASGLRSEKRFFFFPLSHSLCCSLLFRSPVHTSRYKRYTFFRPGFEVFFAQSSPPRSHFRVAQFLHCSILLFISILIFLKVRRSFNHLGFRGRLFPLGRAYKYAECIFCNTWFQIPCWQIVHVHMNIIMARLSYSSPPFNTKIYLFFHGHGSDRMFL